jgi:hypothetical protein
LAPERAISSAVQTGGNFVFGVAGVVVGGGAGAGGAGAVVGAVVVLGVVVGGGLSSFPLAALMPACPTAAAMVRATIPAPMASWRRRFFVLMLSPSDAFVSGGLAARQDLIGEDADPFRAGVDTH